MLRKDIITCILIYAVVKIHILGGDIFNVSFTTSKAEIIIKYDYWLLPNTVLLYNRKLICRDISLV